MFFPSVFSLHIELSEHSWRSSCYWPLSASTFTYLWAVHKPVCLCSDLLPYCLLWLWICHHASVTLAFSKTYFSVFLICSFVNVWIVLIKTLAVSLNHPAHGSSLSAFMTAWEGCLISAHLNLNLSSCVKQTEALASQCLQPIRVSRFLLQVWRLSRWGPSGAPSPADDEGCVKD